MAPDAYPDTSFLFSLACRDSRSAEAEAYMARSRELLVFTPLHRIEARNALRNAAARKVISASESRAGFRQIDDDLREGLLVHLAVAWTEVFRRADELSEEFAAAGGQRTIDLLHVALALECGARTFLSFDQRQRKLAKAAGLKVHP